MQLPYSQYYVGVLIATVKDKVELFEDRAKTFLMTLDLNIGILAPKSSHCKLLTGSIQVHAQNYHRRSRMFVTRFGGQSAKCAMCSGLYRARTPDSNTLVRSTSIYLLQYDVLISI